MIIVLVQITVSILWECPGPVILFFRVLHIENPSDVAILTGKVAVEGDDCI